MEQAKSYVCPSCASSIPLGHKFCGRCGAASPTEVASAKESYYGTLQTPGRAKVVLLRGDGVEGLSYQLNSEHHLVGREGQIVFDDDVFLSARHADLYYRDGQLYAKDEGSLNGVYVRIREDVPLEFGDTFLAGDQLFRLDVIVEQPETPDARGTFTTVSPSKPALFRVSQILQGGGVGLTVRAEEGVVQIGREGHQLNFPTDIYLSSEHCRLEERNGRVWLVDLGSRNGVYVRIRKEIALRHGDCLFVGKKLLRVEINA